MYVHKLCLCVHVNVLYVSVLSMWCIIIIIVRMWLFQGWIASRNMQHPRRSNSISSCYIQSYKDYYFVATVYTIMIATYTARPALHILA